jgi:hypothetical protein
MRFAATVIPQKNWKVIYEGKKNGAPWRKRDLIMYKIIDNEKEKIEPTENRAGIRN